MATKTKTSVACSPARKLACSDPPADTRDKTADHVADWMHANCPSWSIDELLTWPYQAVDMALWVLKKLHRRPSGSELDGEIHRICKAALNARKRGDLKRDFV